MTDETASLSAGYGLSPSDTKNWNIFRHAGENRDEPKQWLLTQRNRLSFCYLSFAQGGTEN